MSEDLMARFREIFERAKEKIPEIGSWNKVYQFIIEDDGEFYVEIRGGEARIVEGRHESPIATIQAKRETLDKILAGELDAMKAFMTRQLKITGNVFDTMNLKKIIDHGVKG